MSKKKDLTGFHFGKWTVIKQVGEIPRKNYAESVWLCRCDCGVEKPVRARLLLHKTSNSRSCGCARAETQRIKPSRLKHGLSKKHPLYKVWKTMRQRCSNPNNKKYHRYGARGIRVCERWDDFENFVEDMGPSYVPGLTIDRRDNDLGYSPDNCRWVSHLIQANNTSKQQRHLVILPSHGFTEADWAAGKENPVTWATVEKLLANTVDVPDDVKLYRWVDEDNVVLEFTWREHERVS